MAPSVGSPADVSCPKCPSRRAKVALHAHKAIFYRCEKCHHVWRVPEAALPVTRRKAS